MVKMTNILCLSNPEQCYECSLKQKYVSNAKSKCLKHMFEQQEKQNSKLQMSALEQISLSLHDIASLLPQFTQELAMCPNEQGKTYMREILETLDAIKKGIYEAKRRKNRSEISLSNFQIQQSNKKIEKQSEHNHPQTCDRSQVQDSQIQRSIINDSIIEWVLYFSQQLVISNSKKKISLETTLPHENDFEMAMFKDKINRKYEDFMKKIQGKEKLLNKAINDLVDHIQKQEKSIGRQNNFFGSSWKPPRKIIGSVTPLKGLQTPRTYTGRSTSRYRNQSTQCKPLKITTSSFEIDNVSVIFPQENSKQANEDTFLLLFSQAQAIQCLLSK